MLDGVSLDQLRTFITAVDEGSFSAAARRLRRAQSAISELVRSLEEQLDVTLFDRTGRYPRLTPVGTALLANARDIVAGVDAMKSRAKGMAAGLEPELTIVVDVFYPIDVLTNAAKAFREQFPNVPLRIYVEALGAAYQPVLDRHASVGIVSFLPVTPPGIVTEPLGRITLAMVAAADHPLAAFQGPIPRQELARHVQLVLTDRSEHSRGESLASCPPKPGGWRTCLPNMLFCSMGWDGAACRCIPSSRTLIVAGSLNSPSKMNPSTNRPC
ncbi:HTH-type transcriptional activator AllS [Dickeya solani]|nr:HTH-type transcriptional activator AllS [Dickeya solani]